MQPLKYTAVTDETTAITTVTAEEQAVYIAGGTTLIDLMRLDVAQPTHVVDITGLPLNDVTPLPTGIRIGALARNSDVAYHSLIREHYPLLSQALLAGASGQLRNMATIGGNLMQRTRCPYFRDVTQACNKRNPGTGCTALHAPHRQHAILGTSDHCIAVHPSDLCVALVALDAQIHIQGQQRKRSIPIREFYMLPGEHPEQETLLEKGELITSVDVPMLPFAKHSLYLKIRDRASYAFALVAVAAALDIQDGIIRDARLALGGVATRPWHFPEIEQALRGKPAETQSYQEAARLAIQSTHPLPDNKFKVELMQQAIVNAFTRVGARQ